MHLVPDISVLTFPPSALYSFSSPSRSLARPKSVIFTWFGDFTRTLRAAKSRCTSLLSSRYIIPWRMKNSGITLMSLTCLVWFLEPVRSGSLNIIHSKKKGLKGRSWASPLLWAGGGNPEVLSNLNHLMVLAKGKNNKKKTPKPNHQYLVPASLKSGKVRQRK